MPKFRIIRPFGVYSKGDIVEGEYNASGQFVKIWDPSDKTTKGWLAEKRFEEIPEDTEVKENPMELEEKDSEGTYVGVNDLQGDNEDLKEEDWAALPAPKESLVDASMESIREILELIQSSGGTPESTGGPEHQIHLYLPGSSPGYVIVKANRDKELETPRYFLPDFKMFVNYGSALKACKKLRAKETDPNVNYVVVPMTSLKLEAA